MIRILRVKSSHRNEMQMKILIHASNYLKFFEKMEEPEFMQSKKIVEKLCRAMYYQESLRGETLIRTGAIPDKFYVLLSGEVIVIKRRDPFTMDREMGYYNKIRTAID